MDLLSELPAGLADPQVIGEGATAVVWRCQDERLGGPVALKVARAGLARHARFRARFAREVALTARVVHPHIVPVYDHGLLSDGRPYVVMAYADQGSMADHVEEPPAPSVWLTWVEDILEGLSALHATGLVHQDLKPENVLIFSSGGRQRAWLSDLGVAGARVELTLGRRGVTGTPSWMAPEQRLARPQEVGPWTDLYSLGLIVNELLGGMLPPLEAGVGFPPVHRKLALPADTPDFLGDFLRKILHPDPRQRFDRAADALRALRRGSRGAGLGDVGTPSPTTTFNHALFHETTDVFAGAQALELIPRWNRVQPDPMPVEAPPPPSLGGRFDGLPLVALREPPLLHFQPLRAELWRLARAVVSTGRPAVALVVGWPDSGKSAVVEQITRALDAGAWMEPVVLRYHDPPQEDDGYRGALEEILAPWGDTGFDAENRLSRWLARDQGVPPATARGEASALVRWCGFSRPGAAPANAALGLAGLLRHLDARCWRGAACLALEDAHLATEPGDGLALLQALLDGALGERPLLAVATLDQERLRSDAELAASVRALEAAGALRIELPRVDENAVAVELTESFHFESALAEELAPRCGGSLVFAHLFLKDCATRGLVERGPEGAIRLREGLSIDLVAPSTLSLLCERRVDGVVARSALQGETADALHLLALIGRAPPTNLARSLCGDGLEGLLATGIVVEVGGRLVFEHPEVQASAARRAEARLDQGALHIRIADAWAELGRNTGVSVDFLVGRHAAWGGDPGRALTPLLQAARSALRAGRPRLAVEAAGLAREVAGDLGSRTAEVDARLIEVEARLELEELREVRVLLDGLGTVDRRAQAQALLFRSRLALAEGQLVVARRQLEDALARFEAIADRVGQVESQQGLGVVLRLVGDPTGAAHRYSRMLELNRGQDARAECAGLAGRVECAIASGTLEGVEKDLHRLRSVAVQSGDTRNLARSSYAEGLWALRYSRLTLAEACFRRALALAATNGDDRLQLACENALGEVLRFGHHAAAAAVVYGRAARLAERRNWGPVAALARINLALLGWQEPDRAAAEREIERAAESIRAHPGHWAWIFIHLLRGVWAARDGSPEGAQVALEAALSQGLGRIRIPDAVEPCRELWEHSRREGWETLGAMVLRTGLIEEAGA